MRKNLIHFLNHDFEYLIILSGDQLYRMDFRPLVAQHAETEADITVATIPVGRAAAPGLGIMQMAEDGRVTGLPLTSLGGLAGKYPEVQRAGK